ncbi:hypothetical protein [Nonomuraea sp. NPDC050202]|uniref:hypothetical protein n=1 Tax=Nonomuraea sp. NPDC050202 TaxID=3155035 RepID=UPI0033FC9112
MARELRAAASRRVPPVPVAHPESLRRQIRGWEAGQHRPSEPYRMLYADVFGLSEEELFDVPAPAPLLEDRLPDLTGLPEIEGVVARVMARTGRRLGAATVAALQARAHALRLADDVLPGGDLVEVANRQLDQAVLLHREGSHPASVGRALLCHVGEIAQVAGWIAADAGDPAGAERAYQVGLSAAHEGGDAALESNLLGSHAYLLTGDDRTRRMALTLAEAATTTAAASGSAHARALAWDRLAWVHARMGAAAQAARALVVLCYVETS